jgi:hypothetical protein
MSASTRYGSGAAVVGGLAAGYYASGQNHLSTPTRALVSDGLDLDSGDAPGWILEAGRLGTLRVTASGTNAEPVFVGIAPTSKVNGSVGARLGFVLRLGLAIVAVGGLLLVAGIVAIVAGRRPPSGRPAPAGRLAEGVA